MKRLRATFNKAAHAFLRRTQTVLQKRNLIAEIILQGQIRHVADARAKSPLAAYPQNLDAASFPLQNHALKTNAALTIYPNPRLAKVLLKKTFNAANQPLIVESTTPDGRRRVGVWNEQTQSRDIHEEIHTESGSSLRSQPQFAAYYDVTSRRITLNYAGTVFVSIDDLKSAAQTITEAASLRMTRVKPCIDHTVEAFKKHYPALRIEDTPIDIYAHSAGANAVPLANYFLQRGHGLVPRSQIMFEALGAKNSFETVADMVAKSEGRDSRTVFDTLARNTVCFKAKRNTLIDNIGKLGRRHPGLGNSPATVGQHRVEDVHGNSVSAHRINAWVSHFHDLELKALGIVKQAIKRKRRFGIL